jgi:spermidine/putrescine transport system substrate-binding protein
MGQGNEVEPRSGDPREIVTPDLVRGLTQPRVSRRRFMRGAAGLALAGSLAGALSACGIAGTRDTGWEDGFDWNAWWAKQTKQGTFNFANWPLYIDRTKDGSPTLNAFSKKYGITVNYRPVIQDNASFFAQISPVLQAGQSTGYDMVVISNGWELTQMIKNHWLIPLDHSQIPNFKRYASPALRDPVYDPGNEFTVTWQSGMTGIAYDRDNIDREINSVKDLWDPAFKGKVGMMADNTELGSVGMLALGIEPSTSTPADWKEAAALLTKQRDAGIVRQYYDQSYIKALQQGDTWISQAWSGDVFQAQVSGNSNLEFVVPKEGAMFWQDNCMIPYHAAHPLDALMWIDYFYRPEVQALITDWVNYISPVPDAQPIIAGKLDDPGVANSPLIFPTPQMESRFVAYYDFKGIDDHEEWASIFDPIIQS